MKLTDEIIAKYTRNGTFLNPYQAKLFKIKTVKKGWISWIKKKSLNFEDFIWFKESCEKWKINRFNRIDHRVADRKIHELVKKLKAEGTDVSFSMTRFRHVMIRILKRCSRFITSFDVAVNVKEESLTFIIGIKDAKVTMTNCYKNSFVDVDDNGTKGVVSLNDLQLLIENYRPKQKVILRRKSASKKRTVRHG